MEENLQKQENQLWINIVRQIKKYYPEYDNKMDMDMCRAFFKAGFNIYPESGFMFQKKVIYEDESLNHACIDIKEARVITKCLKGINVKAIRL